MLYTVPLTTLLSALASFATTVAMARMRVVLPVAAMPVTCGNSVVFSCEMSLHEVLTPWSPSEWYW